MSDPQHGRARRIIVRLLLVVVSLSFGLVAAELVFRAQLAADDTPGDDDQWYVRYRRMNETIYRRSPETELIYEPVPGAEVEMEYGTAGFNAGGLRASWDVPLEPGEDVRVAVVGDSVAWGEFLAVHDAPPQQIDEALGDGYEVLSFGVSGYDTVQEAAYYEQRVRAYRPAVVVVVFCMNDFLIMSGPFERFANDEERAQKDAQEAWLARVADVRRETLDGVLASRERDARIKLLARAWGLWERHRFEAEYIDEPLLAFGDDARRERALDAITRLGRAILADGAKGLLVVSPILESWDDYRWSEIHEQVIEVAEGAGFAILDPVEAWRGAEDPDSMRFDTLHYDRSGSRVFGETVADAVRALE